VGFEKAFGIKTDTILRMQAAYDLAQARMREREILVDRVAARRTQRSNISRSVGTYIINRTLDIPAQAIR
jgi:plasmid maintenance system antidote protein VapI